MSKPARTHRRYIWERPQARYLWFRMAVPKRYESIAGKKIVQQCLGTNDKQVASTLAGRLRADFIEQWEGQLAPSDRGSLVSPTREDLKMVAHEIAYNSLTTEIVERFENRGAVDRTSAEDYRAWIVRMKERFAATKRGESRPRFTDLADRSIKKRNWDLPRGTPEYEAYVDMLAECAIDGLGAAYERSLGNYGVEPRSPIAIEGAKLTVERARPGETIMELFEQYIKRQVGKGKKNENGIKQDRQVVELFSEFVGNQRSLRSITKKDAIGFRDMIARLPAGRGKKPALRGLTIGAAIALAEREQLPLLSHVTQQRYLSTVAPFLAEMFREGRIETKPFDGLHFNPKRGTNPRAPFTNDQLNIILGSPLFTGFLSARKLHQPGTMQADDSRKWIPLLCLFTGARISEVAQLRVTDIDVIDGFPLAVLVHDEGRGQSVKNKKSRLVVLHSKLVAAGFLDFWVRQKERSKADGNPQLFAELKIGSNGTWGEKSSKDWRRYLAAIGIKTGKDGLGSHSFRHRLADEMRRAGFLDLEFGQLVMGHGNRSMTSFYGEVKQGTAKRLQDMIEQAAFDGVDFSKILPTS